MQIVFTTVLQMVKSVLFMLNVTEMLSEVVKIHTASATIHRALQDQVKFT